MANVKILEQKQKIIDEVKTRVEENNSIVLFDYRGLTDAEIKELRCALRESDADYKVYKNTLMSRAFNDLNIDLAGYNELATYELAIESKSFRKTYKFTSNHKYHTYFIATYCQCQH